MFVGVVEVSVMMVVVSVLIVICVGCCCLRDLVLDVVWCCVDVDVVGLMCVVCGVWMSVGIGVWIWVFENFVMVCDVFECGARASRDVIRV